MSTASADATRSLREADQPAKSRPLSSWTDLFLLLLTVSACAMYVWKRLPYGWLPEDDGLLGQNALRVLHRQIPHADFAENYTGGLDYIHAATFKLFGVSAFSMRTALFALSIPFLLSMFYIGWRLSGANIAALVTVLATAWSVPVYPTPMPSWYNMYFAMFGAAALVRFLDAGRRRWLIAAGIASGLSIDVKIIGLYFVAGTLLFFLFREQELNSSVAASRQRSYLYSTFVIAGLVLFVAAVAKLVGRNLEQGDAIHFLFPSMALAALLVTRELRSGGRSDRERFFELLRMVVPFLAGCLLPILLLLIPYVRSGSVHLLFQGVISKGMAMAQGLTRIHAELAELGLTLPPLVYLLVARFWRKAVTPAVSFALAMLLGVALVLAIRSSEFSEAVFYSASMMTPWVVGIGVCLLVFSSRFATELTSERRQQIMLLVSVTAICSLVQFPFPAPVYFCYFAPLLALALLVLFGSGSARIASPAIAALVLFYALFGILRVVPGNIYEDGKFQKHLSLSTLQLDRAGGIKVERPEEYERLIRAVQLHARNNVVVATPECPDIYFFSGLRNASNNDGKLPPAQLAEFIARDDVYVVVLNLNPYFSPQLEAENARQDYRKRFPYSEVIGKYLLLWR